MESEKIKSRTIEWENVTDVIQKRFSKTEVWLYIFTDTPCAKGKITRRANIELEPHTVIDL